MTPPLSVLHHHYLDLYGVAYENMKRTFKLVVTPSRTPRFIFVYILLTACSKGHFGNKCNDTCDGCIS